MASAEKQRKAENFNSTANLTSNAAFQSTFSIASKDIDNNDKPYKPFENRQVEHPNSTLGSIANLLKGCLGSGILAMPAAFKNAGLLAGVIGTLLAGFICTHTVHLIVVLLIFERLVIILPNHFLTFGVIGSNIEVAKINLHLHVLHLPINEEENQTKEAPCERARPVKTSQQICVEAKKPSMGYAETCGAVFTYGPKRLQPWDGFIKLFVDFSMSITYVGLLCVYVVFISSSVKEVVDFYVPDSNISIQIYCVITLIPLIVICQIRNLKYLVPFSTVANFLVVVVFSITMYYIFTDLPSVDDREMVASVSQWPLFLSTVIFAIEGIGVVMPVENEMAHPEKFLGCPGVLNTAMFIVISLHGIFGFFGYLKYGAEGKGSVTLNLPQNELTAQSAKLLMALVIYFSYALLFYVPMDFIQRIVQKKQSNSYENLTQVGMRAILVSVTVAIAAAFPNLELVISFVGAIFFSTLGLFIPAAIDTIHRWDKDLGRFNWLLIKNLIIMGISMVALVSGAYMSIVGMLSDSPGHSLQNTTLT